MSVVSIKLYHPLAIVACLVIFGADGGSAWAQAIPASLYAGLSTIEISYASPDNSLRRIYGRAKTS